MQLADTDDLALWYALNRLMTNFASKLLWSDEIVLTYHTLFSTQGYPKP
jgi:hypothetical protein